MVLRVQAGDLRELPISPSTNPVRLPATRPSTLLFIQAARAADSSADAGLDRDAVFAVGNVFTGKHTLLIVT
jgi:hypothetical protein